MDILCQAKSGMGKTAVFVLATLQQLEPQDGQVSVIVMCHTRELAFQISKEYERFSKYMSGIKVIFFFTRLNNGHYTARYLERKYLSILLVCVESSSLFFGERLPNKPTTLNSCAPWGTL